MSNMKWVERKLSEFKRGDRFKMCVDQDGPVVSGVFEAPDSPGDGFYARPWRRIVPQHKDKLYRLEPNVRTRITVEFTGGEEDADKGLAAFFKRDAEYKFRKDVVVKVERGE